jgi:S-adenosylmethionine:tRNA ribosyltransferase-isomerase
VSAVAFELPRALEATEPAEARGLARDEVRLMVAERISGRIEHARFRDLPSYLTPGDVVVVNTSATLPAALAGTHADGSELTLHVATAAPHLPGGTWWIVELRGCSATRTGDRVDVDGGAAFELVAPYAGGTRLWLARFEGELSLTAHLARHGRPIRYGYVTEQWPLEDYQTVYATQPGSAEMPSAGRPFTAELITRLVAGGVLVAPLTLHTGVSSPERHEPPYPERYEVPAATARLVNAAHGWGGRVIAVGTTVVRALESATAADGTVSESAGWTGLVVTPERGLWAIDGLITGWHEPEASHLQLLEAAAGDDLLRRCYDAALAVGYLWHEFGDSHLILP